MNRTFAFVAHLDATRAGKVFEGDSQVYDSGCVNLRDPRLDHPNARPISRIVISS
jgi:hypothetical protein